MICLYCKQKLKTRFGICSVCRRFIAPDFFYEEAKSENEWRFLCAVAPYEFPLTRWIYQYKSNDKIELEKPLAALLCAAWFFFNLKYQTEVEAIIAVPLSKKRQFQRRFNQTELLAKRLSKWLALPLLTNCLAREDRELDQKMLSRTQRQKNIKNAFVMIKKLHAKRILLIDDVITTGSTVNEISRVLKENGAISVDVLCLARTL